MDVSGFGLGLLFKGCWRTCSFADGMSVLAAVSLCIVVLVVV